MIVKCTKNEENRYVIVDEFGNTIDDAQGYGYKSVDAAWNYAWHQALNHNANFAHLLSSPNGKIVFMPPDSVPQSMELF